MKAEDIINWVNNRPGQPVVMEYHSAKGKFVYTMNPLTDLERIYREDLQKLEAAKAAADPTTLRVIQDIESSLKKSLAANGDNFAYTCKDTYNQHGAGLKEHRGTGEFYLTAVVKSVEVIERNPNAKPDKPSLKTDLGKALGLNCTSIRLFKLAPDKVRAIAGDVLTYIVMEAI